MTFDQFGWRGLGEARAERLEFNQLVGLACSYYASELAADRTDSGASPRPAAGRAGQAGKPAPWCSSSTRSPCGGWSGRPSAGGFARRACASMLRYSTSLSLDAGRVAERITRRTNS